MSVFLMSVIVRGYLGTQLKIFKLLYSLFNSTSKVTYKYNTKKQIFSKNTSFGNRSSF